MHFTSVDLPAPLSPRSARISPKRTVRSAPRSASRWPKRLWMPRHSIATLPTSCVVVGARLAKLEHLHPLVGEELDAVGEHPCAVLPAPAELGPEDERVDLESHVLRERVVRGLFDPWRLNLDQPEAVTGAVEVEIFAAVLAEEGAVALRDIARHDAGAQTRHRRSVRLETEPEDLALVREQPSERDRPTHARRVAGDASRDVQLDDLASAQHAARGARDRVPRVRPREDVLDHALVFGSALVDRLLRDAHDLQ